MKKCKNCQASKKLDEFYNLKSSKDGKQPICKICDNKKQKDYHNNNRNKILLRKKQYRESEMGKLKTSEYRKVYYSINKKIENKRSNDWNKAHREIMKIYNNEYSKEYYKMYPHLKAWRGILHNSLRNLDKKKENTTIELLGYSALDLKNHIEALFTDGMSWANYGEWHIDHIFGVINFDKETPLHVVNALSNLRPMWSTTREINGILYEGNLNRKKYLTK